MQLSPLAMLLACGVYFAVLALLGIAATRRASSSPEEYFLAGRGLSNTVLFMALFGTNCTSFVLVGIPGISYRLGVGVFGLNAAIVALGVPLSFWAIGAPARRMARRLGALTPAELFARRFESRAVGWLLFLAFTAYTVPYMVQGVKAAGLVHGQAADFELDPAWISLGVIGAVFVYTSLGGMRATAWTNVFQGFLFLVFMVVAFFWMARSLGGFEAATRGVSDVNPELLRIQRTGLFEPRQWASWGLVIASTVIAFPHMFARLMAASNEAALRRVVVLYPLALGVLWVPAVLIGVWGRGAFPDLEQSDAVFQAMAGAYLPAALGVAAFLAVLAAVMSTLDAQILTLSSMVVRDVLRSDEAPTSAAREIWGGRLFILVVAALVFGLSMTWGDSVFDISRKAFEGYTTLVPTLLLGVRWRRFTAAGALASILVGNAILLASWSGVPLPTFGFLPVFWAFLGAFVAAWGVSVATRAQPTEALERAFGAR